MDATVQHQMSYPRCC